MEKEKSVKILQDLIRIKSENGNEAEVAEYLKKLLEENGIDSSLIEYSEGRSSLVASISNGEGKVLGISGHMDVVNAGNPENWKKDPFGGEIENGVIWGRGASDMKSGLAALTIAMIDIKNEGNFKGTLKLLSTVGEEFGELGARQLTEMGYADDLDGLIIGEPCPIGIIYAHKGSLNYKLSARGKSAHSSMPELGINAINQLHDAMGRINEAIEEEAKKHENKVLGKTFHNITLISGGTQINSIPDYAEYEANSRTIPEFDNEKLIGIVNGIVNELNAQGYNLTLEITADLPAVESSPDSELIKIIGKLANEDSRFSPAYITENMNRILKETGDDIDLNKMGVKFEEMKVTPMVVSGSTDAAQFMRNKKDIELAIYGPGLPVLNHKDNERTEIQQYLDFIEIYKKIITEYLR